MLEIRDLTFTSQGTRKKILDHISFRVDDGEFLAITGPNGSGKSTLAKAIMGLVSPINGEIWLNNSDITKLSVTKRAKSGLAFSWQQPVKFRGIRVYDLLNVANGALMEPSEAEKYLQSVGLDPQHYLLREVNDKLSGGELKRIEIASVLARKVNTIIFDEPEAGIDLWSFENLTRIFKRLKAEHKTLIVISHQERILKIADRIILLADGQIKESGPSAKILPCIAGDKHGVN